METRVLRVSIKIIDVLAKKHHVTPCILREGARCIPTYTSDTCSELDGNYVNASVTVRSPRASAADPLKSLSKMLFDALERG